MLDTDDSLAGVHARISLILVSFHSATFSQDRESAMRF